MLGLYELLLWVRFNRKCPRSSESCNKATTEGGVDLFRRQVRKLGINALKALASELGMSVCGSHLNVLQLAFGKTA